MFSSLWSIGESMTVDWLIYWMIDWLFDSLDWLIEWSTRVRPKLAKCAFKRNWIEKKKIGAIQASHLQYRGSHLWASDNMVRSTGQPALAPVVCVLPVCIENPLLIDSAAPGNCVVIGKIRFTIDPGPSTECWTTLHRSSVGRLRSAGLSFRASRSAIGNARRKARFVERLAVFHLDPANPGNARPIK